MMTYEEAQKMEHQYLEVKELKSRAEYWEGLCKETMKENESLKKMVKRLGGGQV